MPMKKKQLTLGLTYFDQFTIQAFTHFQSVYKKSEPSQCNIILIYILYTFADNRTFIADI